MTYTLIHNGTLIDGNGRAPIPHGAVLVRDERITAVGRKTDIPLPDADIQMIDAQGGAILPGLIDTHVHLVFEGINPMQMMTTPFSLNYYQAIDRMKRTVEAGVTSVRDAGGADLGMKQAAAQGLVLGPRMQISITVL
ncbi:MAG TPA: amidohydrolase family protein, partial [Chloroflexota bacterium]|nr:amidohydrolase family protein [Chloroflexota bacterium]